MRIAGLPGHAHLSRYFKSHALSLPGYARASSRRLLSLKPRLPKKSWSRWALWAIGALVLVAGLFGGTVTPGFLSDDFNIVDDLREGGPWSRWAGSGDPFLRPLVSALYFLDYKLWGLHARGYHLTSLLFHWWAVLGVTALVSQLVGRGTSLGAAPRRELALGAGLVFLAHPSHLEPVAWIAARGDLQVTVAALACLIAHNRWRAVGGWSWRASSLLALVAALGSKEAALTLPLTVVAMDFLLLTEGSWWSRLREAFRGAGPLLGALPLYLIVRWWWLGEVVGGYGVESHLGGDLGYLLGQLWTFLSRAVVPRMAGEQLPGFAMALVVMVVAGWLFHRSRHLSGSASTATRLFRLMALSVVLFSVTCLPALNLPLSRSTSHAERLLYLPSIFAAVLLSSILWMSFQSSYGRRLALALVLILCSLQTLQEGKLWRQASLQADTIRTAVLASQQMGKLYLFGVPDSIRGAFVFRNGLRAALRLGGNENDDKFIIVHWVELPELSFPLRAERLGKVFTIDAVEPDPHFRFRLPAQRLSRAVEEKGKGRFRRRFRLPQLAPEDRVLLFSAGGVEVLQEGRS